MLIIALMVQFGLGVVSNGLEEMARGHYVEAAEAFRQLAAELQSAGGDRSLLATALNNEAEACRRSGSYEKAESLYRQAIDLLQSDGTAQRQLATTFTNLGTFYRGTGSYERSLEYYKQAERIVRKIASPQDPLNGGILNGFGTLALIKGDASHAVKYFQRALRVREAPGSDEIELSETLNNLGAAQWQLREYGKAEDNFRRALSILERRLGPDNGDVAVALANLGVLYRTEKRYAEAATVFRRATDIDMKVVPSNPMTLSRDLSQLSSVLLNEGNRDEAEKLLKQALDLRIQHPHRKDSEDAAMLEEYGNVLRSNGKTGDAAAADNEAHLIRSELKYVLKP